MGIWVPVGVAPAYAALSPDSSAADTIEQLQADGKRTGISKVGNGPLRQCSVTSARSSVVRPGPRTVTMHTMTSVETALSVHGGLEC